MTAMSAATVHHRLTALSGLILGIARRYSPAGHAEDYAQDAITHLLIARRNRRLPPQVGDAYLKRAARNHIFSALRAYQRESAYLAEPIIVDHEGEACDLFDLVPDPAGDPEQRLIIIQLIADINRHLNCTQRRIFELLTSGYQQNEIAADLALSTGYISQQVRQIRQLARALDDAAEQLPLSFDNP